MPENSPVSGSCLCGRVALHVSTVDRDVVACHCTQCRKQSGHYFAATRAQDSAITITGDQNLTWYAASADAKRGFCKHCGSNLLWKRNNSDTTSILAGCLDQPTGLKLSSHIFVTDQGDYYAIDDGCPQYVKSD